jgi:predicted DNA-binding transcriptional regulator AlpA
MTERYLRFTDLKARGLVGNWQTLRRWVKREQFPPGRKIAAQTRVWTETEINDWIASRPTGGRKDGE